MDVIVPPRLRDMIPNETQKQLYVYHFLSRNACLIRVFEGISNPIFQCSLRTFTTYGYRHMERTVLCRDGMSLDATTNLCH
jgi:hypothetical protein